MTHDAAREILEYIYLAHSPERARARIAAALVEARASASEEAATLLERFVPCCCEVPMSDNDDLAKHQDGDTKCPWVIAAAIRRLAGPEEGRGTHGA